MKLIKTLSALAFAIALMATPAFAAEHKQADCCKKAADDKKTCTHKCCVAAAKDGKECEKCGGSGELPKKDKKDKKSDKTDKTDKSDAKKDDAKK
jgi:hypothetical protein